MGNFLRFLIILFIVCTLPVFSKNNAFAGVIDAIQATCWSDCDENKDTRQDIQKLCKGNYSSQQQKAFDDLHEWAKYPKCDKCFSNLEKMKNNFSYENCLKACKVGINSNCENWAKHIQDTINKTHDEASETRKNAEAVKTCFTAKVASASLAVLGTALLVAGTIVTGGAVAGIAAAVAAGTSALAAIGTGIAGLATLSVGIGAIIKSNQPKGYPAILRNFVSFDSPNQTSGCWFCPVFETIFMTVNELATTMYEKLRDASFTILIICILAWLLWTVLKFITQLHGPNIGEFMTSLFKGLGAAMLVAIVLKAPASFIAGYVIEVPANIATGLADEVMNVVGIGGRTTIYTPYEDKNGCTQYRVETNSFCDPSLSSASAAAFTGKMLSINTYDSMLCMLRKMSFAMIRGMAMGATIIDYSFRGGIFPKFLMLFGGIAVFLAYFVLFILFPVKLFDLLIRIAFVLVLLPLFVLSMATKATRKYAEKGWQMFLGCWITLICLCLFMVFAIVLMSAAFTGSQSAPTTPSAPTNQQPT